MNDKELRTWVARRLKALRVDMMERNPELSSIKNFAKKAKLSPEHVYKVERGGSSPTVETLNSWLLACDTDLPEFFSKMLSKKDLAIMTAGVASEADKIRILADGLDYAQTHRIISDTADHVVDFLKLLEKKTGRRGRTSGSDSPGQ